METDFASAFVSTFGVVYTFASISTRIGQSANAFVNFAGFSAESVRTFADAWEFFVLDLVFFVVLVFTYVVVLVLVIIFVFAFLFVLFQANSSIFTRIYFTRILLFSASFPRESRWAFADEIHVVLLIVLLVVLVDFVVFVDFVVLVVFAASVAVSVKTF